MNIGKQLMNGNRVVGNMSQLGDIEGNRYYTNSVRNGKEPSRRERL